MTNSEFLEKGVLRDDKEDALAFLVQKVLRYEHWFAGVMTHNPGMFRGVTIMIKDKFWEDVEEDGMERFKLADMLLQNATIYAEEQGLEIKWGVIRSVDLPPLTKPR